MPHIFRQKVTPHALKNKDGSMVNPNVIPYKRATYLEEGLKERKTPGRLKIP